MDHTITVHQNVRVVYIENSRVMVVIIGKNTRAIRHYRINIIMFMVLLLEPFKDVQNCKFVHYWTVEKASRKLDTYLGLHLVSVVTDEGSKQEILSRIAQTVGALSKLKTTWKDKDIALSSKIKMMRSLVISIFLYACETWTLTEELERKIQTTDMECFRRLLGSCYEWRSEEHCQTCYWVVWRPYHHCEKTQIEMVHTCT